MIPRTSLADGENSVPPLPTASGTIRTEHSVQSLNSTEDSYITNELKAPSPRPVLRMPGFSQRAKAIILASPLNALLICIPISWSLRLVVPNCHLLNFVFSSLAIIHLKHLLSIITHELSGGFGESVAYLLEATTGNAVEFIVGTLAIVHCELQIAPSLLVGSILGNLLLVLGLGYYAGAIAHQDLRVTRAARCDAASLIFLSLLLMTESTAFVLSVFVDKNGDDQADFDTISLSRGYAVLCLVAYLLGTHFTSQLRSRAKCEEDNIGPVIASTSHPAAGGEPEILMHRRNSDLGKGIGDLEASYDIEDCEDKFSPCVATCIVLLVVAAMVVTAVNLVENIRGVTAGPLSFGIEWLSLILIPAASKIPELLEVAATNDKRIHCIEVVIGSSLQIVGFIIPLMVILAWIVDKSSLMLFDPFESITFFLVAFLINELPFDNPSRIQGLLFIGSYAGIALFFWFYPRMYVFNHEHVGAVQAAFAH